MMKNILRKLRGVLGNGLVWGVAWMLGAVLFTLLPAFFAGAALQGNMIAAALAGSGMIGFITGSVFSVVLGVTYRNRLLEDIRMPAMGVLGAAAGMAIPFGILAVVTGMGASIPLGALGAMLLSSGALGAAVSVGSLRLARHAALTAPDEKALLTE